MTNYVQTKDELLAHLRDQIGFIITSAVSFDNGFDGEGKRLAVTIRVLVHDTRQSTSLLTLLTKKDILFYDSAPEYDHTKHYIMFNGLTMMRYRAGEGTYLAPLDSPSRDRDKKVGFDRWWLRNIVYKDSEGNTFTRKDLVLTVANKEGGAHIDPQLDQAYARLSRFNSLGWKVFVSDQRKDFENTPIMPSIRQIAHEVLKTLRDGAMNLVPSGDPVWERFKTYEEHCQKVLTELGLI